MVNAATGFPCWKPIFFITQLIRASTFSYSETRVKNGICICMKNRHIKWQNLSTHMLTFNVGSPHLAIRFSTKLFYRCDTRCFLQTQFLDSTWPKSWYDIERYSIIRVDSNVLTTAFWSSATWWPFSNFCI